MTETEIRELVSGSAELQALLPDHAAVAAAISQNRKVLRSTFHSERGILEKYPEGPIAADILLSKLEAFASAGHPLSSIVKRALKFMAQAEGLDIGSASTQGMITQLGIGGVLTVNEANNLKNMALKPEVISSYEVAAALEGTQWH